MQTRKLADTMLYNFSLKLAPALTHTTKCQAGKKLRPHLVDAHGSLTTANFSKRYADRIWLLARQGTIRAEIAAMLRQKPQVRRFKLK